MSQYLSKSRLDLINKSPYLYYWKYLSGQYIEPEATPALTFGKALHCRVFEPGEFGKRYATIPPNIDRRTKEGKEKYQYFIDSLNGHALLTQEQHEQIERMHHCLMVNPLASALIQSEGVAEQVIEWEYLGQAYKGIIDKYNATRGIIIDLKTTDDASPYGFARSIKKYRYHVQAAMYLDGMRMLGYEPQAFIFIAIEKTPPYQIGLYYLSDSDLRYGADLYLQDTATFQECTRLNRWPMYNNQITEITL